MKRQKSKTISYFLIALCITCSLMFIKKSNYLNDISGLIIPRNLFETEHKEYVCDKAGSRLTDKYNEGYDEESLENKTLTSAQQSIIDFARDTSYDNIKPYIKRLAIFIVLLVLDIIFIIFWIIYCCCSCCNCCLFGKANPPNNTCSKYNFLLSIAFNILVIIFSIIVLCLINPFFKRINGMACSTFNFLDHIRYGLNPHYPSHKNEWEGINGLVNRLQYSQNQRREIYEYNKVNCSINNDNDNTCSNYYKTFKDECTEIKELISSSFDDIDFDDEIYELENAKQSLDDSDRDIGEDIYDALHDYINGIAKRIYIAIFVLTLIFGILGIVLIFLYGKTNYCIFKVLYVVIWNISMIFMLLAVIAAVTFGIIGYIAKDGVAVTRYILSSENMNSTDPLIFNSYDDDNVNDLIDVCANGDGNFFEIIQDSGKIYENIKDLENKNQTYTKTINEIRSCPEDLRSNYTYLKETTSKSLNISYYLTDVKCSFVKNDKNIILNEANSWGKRGITLCAFALLVAFLLGLSILTGILFVHRYHVVPTTIEPNIVPNISTTNIGQENENISNTINNDYINKIEPVNMNNQGIFPQNNLGLNNMNNMNNMGINNMGMNDMNNKNIN